MPINRRLLLAATLTFAATLAAQQSGPVIRVEGPPPQSAQSAAANPDKPLRVSGGVMAGMLVKRVEPEYSPDIEARGSVVLHAIVGIDGRVAQLTVISGPTMLQSAAVEAVRQWVYKPYLLNGNPVAVDTTIVVNFRR